VSDPVQFLQALSQALSTLALYGGGHPATTRTAEAAFERLLELQATRPQLEFTFLAGEVLFGDEVQPALAGWEWSERLAAAGIERVEFVEAVELGEFEWLLAHLAVRLGIRPEIADPRQTGPSSIRLGRVRLAGGGPGPADGAPTIARLSYNLHDERDMLGWIHDEVRSGAPLPLLEADAVVRSLSLAMHAEQAMVLPLLQLKEFDQYTTTHSMNVAVLAMALGDFLELGAAAVRSLGFAALLHDLGKVCIPTEILNKPGPLDDAERLVVERHPGVGAKILLERRDVIEIAAVVAYEHHVMIDGGGYPHLPDARGAQYASRLVHVCDVYDALRTRRPYRDAWTSEQALNYIESRAGLEFDPTIARAFATMIRRWYRRVAQMAAPPLIGQEESEYPARSPVSAVSMDMGPGFFPARPA
jgi:putative nucleotidyltransferase with HDIG domain